jgi:hypothetical protein
MGVFGDIALRAWRLAAREKISPIDAWRNAVNEHYIDPKQRRNALQHTCPKGAFLGLSQNGLVRDIEAGSYTKSIRSCGYAMAALDQLRADPSLANDRPKLESMVFGDRTPNDEVDVVLALWKEHLIK